MDKNRLTLCGDSAGGHLALVTALRLKVKGLWQPVQLILIYPMLDATASFESYALNGTDYIITRDTLLSGYEMYLAETDRQHPETSPLWRDDFTDFRQCTSLPQSTIRCAMREKCCIII